MSICRLGMWKTGMDCSRVPEQKAQSRGRPRQLASQDTGLGRTLGVPRCPAEYPAGPVNTGVGG